MSKASDKMGGLASRWTTNLFECVHDAIDHGVTPREMVLEIQECWDIALHDQKKEATKDFNKLLNQM
jgi:hypothetical protein